MEKAYFFPRLLAYILDIIIVSFAVSIIGLVIPVSDNYETIQKDATELQEKYINEEINMEEFVRQYALITYDLDYASVPSYILEITCVILYFIVFQFYQNGQTFGKKIMNIRIVSASERKLTINDYIYRAMVLNSVLVNLLIVIFVLFMKRDYYFYVSYPLQIIQMIISFITIFMVLFRKDGRGLHDLVGNTKVVMDK